MSDYLQRALQKIGAAEGDVLAYNVSDSDISIVVDNGIKGCPKYTFPLNALPALRPVVEDSAPEQEPPPASEGDDEAVEPDEVVKAKFHDAYSGPIEDLGYRELQALAKEHDIPANQSTDDLIAALTEVYE